MHLAHYDGSLSRYDPRTLVTPESVISWIQFQEIFKWLKNKGWEKPKQLDKLIKSIDAHPFNLTKTKMEKKLLI